MSSIRKSLTRRLSITISILVVTVLLVADIAVDNWVEHRFNTAIADKIGLLKTLVAKESMGIEFKFSGEYLPEFVGTTDPEYFQMWYKGHAFEKSQTLSLYLLKNLPYKSVSPNTIEYENITLPDGRSGRVGYTAFIPQTTDYTRAANTEKSDVEDNSPIYLAYATSTETINYALWFIDAAFILALIIIPLIIRFTVRNTVSFALMPLDTLNKEIRELRFLNEKGMISLNKPVEELTPIIDSLNYFIEENYSLYIRERQLTSNIAHELKTPVTELINLTEVAIRFPDEPTLKNTFKPEVLNIGKRMNSVISSLMIIHKYSVQPLDCKEQIELTEVLNGILRKYNASNIDLNISENQTLELLSNRFALESIVINLLANAIKYRKTNTPISINATRTSNKHVVLSISNVPAEPLSNDELLKMFNPLWQKDSARTSSENFGLGLSIVRTLIAAINANIQVNYKDGVLSFEIEFATNKETLSSKTQ